LPRASTWSVPWPRTVHLVTLARFFVCLFSLFNLFFSTFRLPPRSSLFPYTTLFRSRLGPWTAAVALHAGARYAFLWHQRRRLARDRKSTRLNSSHVKISYAVFCLKKKQQAKPRTTSLVQKERKPARRQPSYPTTLSS